LKTVAQDNLHTKTIELVQDKLAKKQKN